MKNMLKYESYKAAINLLEEARKNKDLPRCIAAIAVAESIIADRCQSYLYYKEKTFMEINEKEKRFFQTKVLVAKCENHFKKLTISYTTRTGIAITSINLFEECKQWLKSRNDILHGFAKSKPTQPSINIVEFHHKAIQTAEDGLRLTKLVNKWHSQQLQTTKKK